MQVLADVRRKFHQSDKDEKQPKQDREAFEHYRSHSLGVGSAGRGRGCCVSGRHGCLGLMNMMITVDFFAAFVGLKREFSEHSVSRTRR